MNRINNLVRLTPWFWVVAILLALAVVFLMPTWLALDITPEGWSGSVPQQ